jgi:hypothetical protein
MIKEPSLGHKEYSSYYAISITEHAPKSQCPVLEVAL